MSDQPLDRRSLLRGTGVAAATVTVAGGAMALTAAPAAAATGAFRPVNPYRAYDSRKDLNGEIIVDGGENSARLWKIPVLTDLAGKTIITAGSAVTAVAFNLTVVAKSRGGFLTMLPGNINTAPSASTINWGGPNYNAEESAVANSGIVKVASAVVQSGKPAVPGVVGVFCGGRGRANFIIDINGYYV